MSFIAIAIWVLIIIGAFMLNVVLGLIVLLGSVFVLFGGLDKKKPEVYPHTLNSTQLEKYKKENEASLYHLIYALLNGGSKDIDIAKNKNVNTYAKDAGIPIDGVESIKIIKTSKSFLEHNDLYNKFVHLANSGHTDKDISKNLIKRWAVLGSAYTKHDISKMRELLDKPQL